MGIVTIESTVVITMLFDANAVSPLYFSARIAVVIGTGIAASKVATPVTVPSSDKPLHAK